jgi:hypothetical protein
MSDEQEMRELRAFTDAYSAAYERDAAIRRKRSDDRSKQPTATERGAERGSAATPGGDPGDRDPKRQRETRSQPVGEEGAYWKSLETRSQQEKRMLSRYEKKADNTGEIRSDRDCYYQFDKMHKGKPGEHLHRYVRRGNDAVLDAEIDPETGAVIRRFSRGEIQRERWF